MPFDFENIRREISIILMSIRASWDQAYGVPFRLSEERREEFTRLHLKAEELRIRFATYGRPKLRSTTKSKLEQARTELLQGLQELIYEADNSNSSTFNYRFVLNRQSSKVQKQLNSVFMQGFSEGNLSIIDALRVLYTTVRQASIRVDGRQGAFDLLEFKEIIPNQQVSPVKFDIRSNVLVIADQTPQQPFNRESTSLALKHIRTLGSKLLDALRHSNCDQRLVSHIEDMHKQVESKQSIIRLGLTNFASTAFAEAYRAELPGAIAASLSAYTASVSVYVAQFPEWEQFLRRASIINLLASDATEINHTTSQLVEKLNERHDIVHPDVPRTIEYIRSLLEHPGLTAKNTVFAVIRTIENLIARVLNHCLLLADKTLEKSVDGFSSVSSKVVVGLSAIALLAATGIMPVAARAGASWIERAPEIIEYLKNLTL